MFIIPDFACLLQVTTVPADVPACGMCVPADLFVPPARMDVVIREDGAELHLNNGAAFPNLAALRIVMDF